MPFPGAGVRNPVVEFVLVFAAVLTIQGLTYLTQARIGIDGGQGYDGTYYYSVAEQLVEGARPSGISRFAQRLGTPLLASLVAPDDLITGFLIVNACAALASALLLLVWLRTYLRDPWLRIVLVMVYATHWLQLVRFTFFYPVLVDAWAQAFCFAGLNCIAWYERRPGRWPVLAMAIISAAGVVFRELVLLIPIAFLFARNPAIEHRLESPYVRARNLPRTEQWIPLVAAIAVLIWVGNFVAPTDPEFSPAEHFAERALSRSLVSYLLGWMIAYGPILFLVAFDWRSAVDFFRRHKAFLVYTLGVAATGWIASLESERHALNWASPIVLVLLGRTIERYRGLVQIAGGAEGAGRDAGCRPSSVPEDTAAVQRSRSGSAHGSHPDGRARELLAAVSRLPPGPSGVDPVCGIRAPRRGDRYLDQSLCRLRAPPTGRRWHEPDLVASRDDSRLSRATASRRYRVCGLNLVTSLSVSLWFGARLDRPVAAAPPLNWSSRRAARVPGPHPRGAPGTARDR